MSNLQNLLPLSDMVNSLKLCLPNSQYNRSFLVDWFRKLIVKVIPQGVTVIMDNASPKEKIAQFSGQAWLKTVIFAALFTSLIFNV